jgi:aspartate ammonia-lyase
LCPHIGYAHAARIAKRALAEKISVKDIVLQENILSEEELKCILDTHSMTEPGISGKELLQNRDK